MGRRLNAVLRTAVKQTPFNRGSQNRAACIATRMLRFTGGSWTAVAPRDRFPNAHAASGAILPGMAGPLI